MTMLVEKTVTKYVRVADKTSQSLPHCSGESPRRNFSSRHGAMWAAHTAPSPMPPLWSSALQPPTLPGRSSRWLLQPRWIARQPMACGRRAAMHSRASHEALIRFQFASRRKSQCQSLHNLLTSQPVSGGRCWDQRSVTMLRTSAGVLLAPGDAHWRP